MKFGRISPFFQCTPNSPSWFSLKSTPPTLLLTSRRAAALKTAGLFSPALLMEGCRLQFNSLRWQYFSICSQMCKSHSTKDDRPNHVGSRPTDRFSLLLTDGHFLPLAILPSEGFCNGTEEMPLSDNHFLNIFRPGIRLCAGTTPCRVASRSVSCTSGVSRSTERRHTATVWACFFCEVR